MHKLFLVALILIALAIPPIFQQKSKNMVKMIKVNRFGPCNTSLTVVEFNSSTVTMTGGIHELIIAGFVNITKDIPSPIKMSMTSLKCDQRGMNCDNYLSLSYPDCCHVMNIPFFSFTKGFEPEVKDCPVPKGIFKTVGAIRYDMSAWMQLAMYNKYLATYHFYGEDKKTIACFEMDWGIVPRKTTRRPRNGTFN